MKIMHVVTTISDEFAGPSYSVPALCTSLQNNGCDVTLYVLGDVPNKTFNFKVKNFERDTFPSKKIAFILGLSKKMYKTMKQDIEQFDVVHSHMLWKAPNYYSGFVAKKGHKPYMIAPRGTVSSWVLDFSKWKKKIVLALGQRKALNAVTCFHATSEEECSDISKFGYSQVPCAISPNGIDIPQLLPLQNKMKRRLTFLSRIHEKKGVDILLRAWNRVEGEFPDWELSIVGPDDHDYALKMKALANDLNCKRVVFTGKIYGNDKIEFLQNSDLFVLPTHSENFGMVVAEALACEVPVICSKGAPWEGLQEYNAGWWIDIGEEPLVTTLKEAMNLESNELKMMGHNGRKWMIRDFSWDAIAKQMIEVYRWMLDQDIKPNTVRERS